MSTWDLHETYNLVEKLFGTDHVDVVRPCLRSIVDRQFFAKYHFHETRRLLSHFKRTHLAEGNLLIALHGHNSAQARDAFERLMIKVGAHATACVQALHAIPDILANGIYFAAGLNFGSNAIAEKDICIATVSTLIKRTASLSALIEPISSLTEGEKFQHLAALSNLSKHRTVVRASLNEDWTGERKALHLFQFSAFSKPTKGGKRDFPTMSFEDLVESEYERISRNIVTIGKRLNQTLE